MKNVVVNIAAASIGGILVLLFQHYFLEERGKKAKVEVEYLGIEYGSEVLDGLESHHELLVQALSSVFVDEVHDNSTEGAVGQDRAENLYKKVTDRVAIRAIAADTIFGRSGYIESISVLNNDGRFAAEVLIEGRDINFAVITSKTLGRLIHRSDFQNEVKLPPNEKIEILNIGKNQVWKGDHLGRSDAILVSHDDEYVSPLLPNRSVDPLLGNLPYRYPFVFFLLVLIGGITLLTLAFSGFFAVCVGVRVSGQFTTTPDVVS